MTHTTDPITALDEAIAQAGSVSGLAALINVAASAPFMWRKRGSVPAEHCPAIERETGVPCERLRPGVDWSVLRGGEPVHKNSPTAFVQSA